MYFDSVFKMEDKAYNINLQTICTAYLLGYLLESWLVFLGDRPPAHLRFVQAWLFAVWMGSAFHAWWAVFLSSFVLSDSSTRLTSGRQVIWSRTISWRALALSLGRENRHPVSWSNQAGYRANKNLEAGFGECSYFRSLLEATVASTVWVELGKL